MTATHLRALVPTEVAVQRLEALRALHKPFGIYDECGHDHTGEQLAAGECIEVDLVGLTCEDGLLYEVCEHCCTDELTFERYQTEACATSHEHGRGRPVCQTIAVLEGAA